MLLTGYKHVVTVKCSENIEILSPNAKKVFFAFADIRVLDIRESNDIKRVKLPVIATYQFALQCFCIVLKLLKLNGR